MQIVVKRRQTPCERILLPEDIEFNLSLQHEKNDQIEASKVHNKNLKMPYCNNYLSVSYKISD